MEPLKTTDKSALLNQKLEEAYQEGLAKRLDNLPVRETRKTRLWEFVNSSFGLWFLSTCVVGLITFLYSEEKNKAEQKEAEQQLAVERARQNASMVTILLPYLASSDARQWKIAMEVTRYLAANGELPGELKSTLDGIVVSYNNAEVSPGQKEKVVAAAAIIDHQVSNTANNGTRGSSFPPRVYVHIADKSQLPFANQLQNALTNTNFIAPGIENVGPKPNIKIPSKTEIRYFMDEDRAEAQTILNLLKGMNPELQMLDVPKKVGNGKGARPRHFEIWFSRT